MWNKCKRLCLLLLVLCLLLTVPATYASGSDILVPDPTETGSSESEGQITQIGQVETGHIQTMRHYPLNAYHPLSVNVYAPDYSVTLVEILVKRNDTVKAGDPVARIQGQADAIELTQTQINLLNAENFMAQGISSREDGLSQLRLRLAAETDPFEREILSLTIQKQELQLSQYRTQQEENVTRLRQQLAALESQNTTDTIYAPADGRVTEVARLTAGKVISPGANLMTISDPSVVLYRANSSSDPMLYGRTVTNHSGTNSSKSVTGTVVGAPNILPASANMTAGYVLMNLPANESPTAVQVELTVVSLENVLLVPYKAVYVDDTNSGYPYYYVTVLRDGKKEKCHINVLYRSGREHSISNTSKYLVLWGVNEGDILVSP